MTDRALIRRPPASRPILPASFSASDNFNQPDGPLGPLWLVDSGSVSVVSGVATGDGLPLDLNDAVYNGLEITESVLPFFAQCKVYPVLVAGIGFQPLILQDVPGVFVSSWQYAFNGLGWETSFNGGVLAAAPPILAGDIVKITVNGNLHSISLNGVVVRTEIGPVAVLSIADPARAYMAVQTGWGFDDFVVSFQKYVIL